MNLTYNILRNTKIIHVASNNVAFSALMKNIKFKSNDKCSMINTYKEEF